MLSRVVVIVKRDVEGCGHCEKGSVLGCRLGAVAKGKFHLDCPREASTADPCDVPSMTDCHRTFDANVRQ